MNYTQALSVQLTEHYVSVTILVYLLITTQAAFECMYTLLDACLDKLDVFEFLSHVEEGLNDHYDIKMLTYLMLTRWL